MDEFIDTDCNADLREQHAPGRAQPTRAGCASSTGPGASANARRGALCEEVHGARFRQSKICP